MLSEECLEDLAERLSLAALVLRFEYGGRDTHNNLNKLVSVEHLLAAFLVLVRADDRLSEALH